MAAPYSVRGRTVATANTAGHAIAGIWNPHASARVAITKLKLFKTAAGTAGDAFELRRSTARGTPGSTVTPLIQNHHSRQTAPLSGLLLDLAAYTVQPTLETVGLDGWVAANVAASGIVEIYMPGIELGPGAGLVFSQVAGTIWPVSEVAVTWEEGA